jgi:hypothetical protein
MKLVTSDLIFSITVLRKVSLTQLLTPRAAAIQAKMKASGLCDYPIGELYLIEVQKHSRLI